MHKNDLELLQLLYLPFYLSPFLLPSLPLSPVTHPGPACTHLLASNPPFLLDFLRPPPAYLPTHPLVRRLSRPVDKLFFPFPSLSLLPLDLNSNIYPSPPVCSPACLLYVDQDDDGARLFSFCLFSLAPFVFLTLSHPSCHILSCLVLCCLVLVCLFRLAS
ncbi:uncharacterized protein IWZ02DRAFT_300055 [Phyllosticta citriasiana]|uniref:uncharacterized protein n=1 Tax=Phyllosticta citriasiana TaxID=595635 RepID=UPI0030FDBD23